MTCSKCHSVNWTFTQKYRRENGYPDFTCPACGHIEDADLNAARNLASQDFASLRDKIEEQKKLLSKQERELEDALFA
jgi:transcription initiation factor IIE alpha subunit